MEALARSHTRRGLRLVVSDFVEPGTSVLAPVPRLPWERPLRRLAARHQVLAVEVVDPREGELPDVGVVALVDPETGQLIEVDTSRAAVREAFAAGAVDHRQQVAAALRRAGCAHLVLRTDSDWVGEVARFVLRHRRVARQLHAPRRGMA